MVIASKADMSAGFSWCPEADRESGKAYSEAKRMLAELLSRVQGMKGLEAAALKVGTDLTHMVSETGFLLRRFSLSDHSKETL